MKRTARQTIQAAAVAGALFALTIPLDASAQTVTLLGRISDAGTDAPVENAIVTLTGLGSTMTTPEGTFRFRGIRPGEYALVVDAFGYDALEMPLDLVADTTVTLTLDAAPLAIDGILVEAGTIDFEGRVRDPGRDFYVVDAEVVLNGRDPMWTDAHGRFDLDDLPEEVPIHLEIRSFGYLPVDTTFVPDDEERYVFELERDVFAEALMDAQVARIEERGAGRAMAGWAGLGREEIMRFTGAHTARSMIEFNFPQRVRGRIACYYVDERRIDGAFGLGAEIAAAQLEHTLPEEIERVELLVFDSVLGRPIMARLYTRTFIMQMATGEATLRQNLVITPTGECMG